MNSFWKKLVSGFLSVLMILPVCPVSAIADIVNSDTLATVEAIRASETPIYAADGQASDPLGTAQTETA